MPVRYKVALLMFVFLSIFSFRYVHAKEEISYQIKMLPWEQANKVIPKYTKFTVMDVETGKKFHVQRRAGSRHADVQPINAKDTKIMKRIYGGKWSWKRRAIIIIFKNQRIAASMHGMPHGAGALKNNFPGHFCIHFQGSTTHKSSSMDLSHQLMILKAAGKLEKHIAASGPYDVFNAFIAGIKQHDYEIVTLTSVQKLRWSGIFNRIENIRVSNIALLPDEDMQEQISMEVPVEINVQIAGAGGRRYKGSIHLVRYSPFDAWKVDPSFLKDKAFTE